MRVAAALATAPASAMAAPCTLAAPAEAVAVERALDGDTVELDDGRLVRLAGVAAPKAPLGVAAADWPLDGAARDALQAASGGRVMELRLAGRPTDRYGRLIGFLAEMEAADHAGVAAAMLGRGMASWTPEERDCRATLQKAEASALVSRLGLWGEPYYEVRDAADGAAFAGAVGRLVVAEGRVASVRTAGGRAYVNFGRRWQDALSLSLSEAALRKLGGFRALRIEAGALLRVRGVVEARKGPTMALSDAGQIERLDTAPRGRP